MKEISVSLVDVKLKGILTVTPKARGLVIFVHGSGSSRLSPRNLFVAQTLNHVGLATLLFDLLTEEEDAVYANRFNIPLLTQRLIAVTNWASRQKEAKDLSKGYFGASTGSAAAINAAAALGDKIKAVVSRGGRPDIAETTALASLTAPTLLIVGGDDTEVIGMNKQALKIMSGEKKLVIIPGATHLFEEPGALEQVTDIAKNWFIEYL